MSTLVNDGKFLTVAATPTAEQAAVARVVHAAYARDLKGNRP